MQVYSGIYLISGVTSNIYIIDGEVIVDAGTGENFAEVKKEIEEKFNPKDLKTLVNTHYHYDHTGGSKKFRDWLKLDVVIHKMDKDFVEKADTLAEKFSAKARIMTIDNTVKEGQMIVTRNFRFQVIHTPGHTPGSICLYDPEHKILFSGDTMSNSGVGRTDLPNSDRTLLLNSLKKISSLSVNYLLPGHGPPRVGGIDFYIKQLINAMENNRDAVAKEI
ncbi:MAG: MBL fold metallo-hydrolase [Candidatus Aenigmarchaeota archaeon]|nr:MBL fold metallo-hydrolase [Candidatus Aenigmarchaeota archaeon]